MNRPVLSRSSYSELFLELMDPLSATSQSSRPSGKAKYEPVLLSYHPPEFVQYLPHPLLNFIPCAMLGWAWIIEALMVTCCPRLPELSLHIFCLPLMFLVPSSNHVPR